MKPSFSPEYKILDAHFMDYKLYQMPGVNTCFRGPAPVGDRYMACVGGAQTFGRFVREPFPEIVAQQLGIEPLNLGRGGAGPGFALAHPALMDRINRAQLVIVQVMSGRSIGNSLFQPVNHGAAGTRSDTGELVRADQFYLDLLEKNPERVRSLVEESRANYVNTMIELLEQIGAPKVLLWFSVRRPDYTEEYQAPLHKLFGGFPQLVNRAMVEAIRPHAEAYVECVSRAGLPQPIPCRDPAETIRLGLTGPVPQVELTGMNNYYPSPEMHREAALALEPVCRSLLGIG